MGAMESAVAAEARPAGEPFGELDRLAGAGGAASVLDALAAKFREQRDYGRLFDALLMKKRAELGLPLIQTEAESSYPAGKRRDYEEAFVDAARQVGLLFLAEGNLERAWPYLRAIGETAPVGEAIASMNPAEAPEAAMHIAFHEGVDPAKGLEMIATQHGMCRAITAFGMQAVAQGREECIALLTRRLYAELVSRLRAAIEQREGAPAAGTEPEADIPAMLAGRDWLFGEWDYYVDTSHLVSVLQYSPDVTDRETLARMNEICHYGRRLSAQFQQGGYAPFDRPFADYGHWVSALLGEDAEAAVEHFRRKAAEADPEQAGTAPAQALVRLLVRLKRPAEAVEVSLAYLDGVPPAEMACPSALQLCHLAGDYARLRALARERGDLLSYAAATLEGAAAARG